MNKIICIELLKSLKKIDLQKFGIFLQSPCINSNKTLIKFYEILRKYNFEFSEGKFKSEIIYSELYQDKHFKEKTIRNLDYELLSKLKKYLGCSKCFENLLYNKNELKDYIGCFNLNKKLPYCISYFEKNINLKIKALKKINCISADILFEKYKLQKLINEFYSNYKKIPKYVNYNVEVMYFEQYYKLIHIEQKIQSYILKSKEKGLVIIGMGDITKYMNGIDSDHFVESLPPPEKT